MFYSYILICFDKSYYVGSTDSLTKRLRDHNSGKGSKFTDKKKPCVIVWYEKFTNRTKAVNRENEIKKFSRVKKEKLIFSKESVWQHYKGNKYIILDIIGDMICYSEVRKFKVYFNKRKIRGMELSVWLRDKNQWLDWIDKKTLRFKFIDG